jgi:hypothetical protein
MLRLTDAHACCIVADDTVLDRDILDIGLHEGLVAELRAPGVATAQK